MAPSHTRTTDEPTATDSDPQGQTAQTATDGGEETVDYDVPEKAVRLRETADAVDRLADRLAGADSIADDCPVLSDLYHEARTSGRDPYEGRFVELLDYDREADEWTSRGPNWLQSGTHYRDTGADLTLSNKPHPFLDVSTFAQAKRARLNRVAQTMRQNADEAERAAKEKAYREQNWSEEDYL